MAGVASKRQREDAQIEEMSEGEELKRQKSFNQILSLLDEEEEEPIEDLSSIITTLQQEISSPSSSDPHQQNGQPNTTATSATVEDYTTSSSSSSSSSSSATSPSTFREVIKEEEEGERERVMRHLLEASDDELGIPNAEFLVHEGVDGMGMIDRGGISLCDALWELEDEAANYYTLFQSQLFM